MPKLFGAALRGLALIAAAVSTIIARPATLAAATDDDVDRYHANLVDLLQEEDQMLGRNRAPLAHTREADALLPITTIAMQVNGDDIAALHRLN